MNRRKFGNSGNGTHRPDAKHMTRQKNRFAALDADISSAYVDDDEIVLQGSRTQGRVTRKPNEAYRAGDRKNRLMQATGANSQVVYNIRAYYGVGKFTAKWLLKLLNQKVESLKPILIKESERYVEFFLKDQDSAETVRAMNRRISNPETKLKIEISMNRTTAPWQQLKREEVEIVKAVVDKRYDAPNRTLDLSNFMRDPLFVERDMMMPLTKNNVMLVVLERIDERYGSIVALNLSANKLKYLDYLRTITSITKFLKVLELSQNQISDEEELQKLSDLPVESLFFEGNPIIESISSGNEYLSLIHRVFPRVSALDGNVVQPLTTMPLADEDERSLEAFPFRAGYYGDDNLRSMVEQFVISFYQMYDGPNGATTRKELMIAYEENKSTFTLALQSLKDSPKPPRYHSDDIFNNYIRNSHNIKYEERFARNRSNVVTKGAMEIAVRLSKLPVTKHMLSSFIVDVFLVTPGLLGFTVQGLFEDGTFAADNQVPKLQFFSRTFTVVRKGEAQLAVISDMLFISPITTERMARYKTLIDKAEKNGAATGPVANLNTVQNASTGIDSLNFSIGPDPSIKEQMVSEFCKFSGMLIPWSTKCLEDCGWNYEKAAQEFTALKASIPREAFAV